MGNRPLIVLTAGKPYDPDPLLTPEQSERQKNIWIHELQVDETHLSSRGGQTVLPDSSHNIPITARKYTSFDEMKADDYRYWQSRPAHKRLDAVEDMIETAYALNGWVIEPNVPTLQRPFVHLPFPWNV